jgi:hypothetical protein
VATVPEGDKLARGKKRTVVVVDRDGYRIRSFGVGGTLRATREADTLGLEDASFDDVDIDYYGNIYAVERRHHRLHKFRDDLYPLDTFGERGTDEGKFLSPRGIAIHRRFGQVFITEEDGGQYLWVGTDVKHFEAEDRGEIVFFSFVLTEESTVEFRILDPQGNEVTTLLAEGRRTPGPQQGSWDGTNERGERVGDGEYVAEIRARATYASRSTYERKLLRPFTIGVTAVSP